MSQQDPFDPSRLRPFRPGRREERPSPPSDASRRAGDAFEPAVAPPVADLTPSEAAAPPSRWSDDVPVRGGEAMMAILAVWAIMVVCSNFPALLSRWIDPQQIPSWMKYMLTLTEHALIIGLLFYLLKMKHEAGLVDGLHLRPGPIRWTAGSAVFGAVVFGGMMLALRALGGDAESRFAGGRKDLIDLVLFTAAAFSGAFALELYFRGLIFPLLRRGVGVVLAVIIVTVWFTFSHGWRGIEPAVLVAMGVLGLGTTLARQFSRSLGPPIAMHGAYNLCVCIYLWLR